MIATYVDPVKTPMALMDAAMALRTALSAGRSELVRDDVLCLALAKSALETGRWRSMWNWNWGNVKAGESYVGMYTCIRLNEVIDGEVVWFSPQGQEGPNGLVGQVYDVPPGHPQTRIRAYANRYDGAYSYVEALVQHFPRSYEMLFTADPVTFVNTLKAERYFTAAEGPYRSAVISLQNEFLRTVRGFEPEETDHDWDGLRARVRVQQFDPLELGRDEFGDERIT